MKYWRETIFAMAFLALAQILFAQVPLPPDVPVFTYQATPDVAPGTIFTSAYSPTDDSIPTSILMIDEQGFLVFYLELNPEPGPPYSNIILGDFKLLNDGKMAFNYTFFNDRKYLLMDSTLAISDTMQCDSGLMMDGHEFIRTADGHFHYFCYIQYPADLSGMTTINNTPGSSTGTVLYEKIVEKDEFGNVVFEWDPSPFYALTDIYNEYFTNPGILDLTHYNSIEVDSSGNYILSSRHLQEVLCVDKSSGQIAWRFGGKNNQFALLNDTTWFSGQHDARITEPGKLSLFDNATINGKPARGIEYILDTASMTATVNWAVPQPYGYHSEYMGNMQTLSNGNRLIDWSGVYPQNLVNMIEEYGPDSSLVMSLDFPDSWLSYRAVKFELPWELPRPQITCSAGDMRLTASPGFSNYYWSNGQTGQSIMVTAPGWYQVWVDHGNGRLSSEPFNVITMGDICQYASETQLVEKTSFEIYPNPFGEFLFIDPDKPAKVAYQINDLQGKRLQSGEFSGNTKLILTGFPDGMYFLNLRTGNEQVTRKIIKAE